MMTINLPFDPILAMVVLFAGDFAPYNWLDCNGQLINIKHNKEMFSMLNNEYGGDGINTFALPNLPTQNGIRYIINEFGIYPNKDKNYEIDLYQGLIGIVLPFTPGKDLNLKPYASGLSKSNIVIPYSKTGIPGGWLPCDGRELNFAIFNEYQLLFRLIGNRYGGSVERATFKLPNLNNDQENFIICVEGKFPVRF